MYTDDFNRLYSQINKVNEDLLKSGFERTSEILSSQERISFADENRQHRNAQHIIDVINTNGSANLTATERNGSANLAATQKATSDLGIQAERLQNETATFFGELSDKVHHVELGGTKNTAEIVVAVNKAENVLGRQAGDYFAKSQQDLVRVENSLGRLADSHFSSLQNQASVNSGKLAYDIAKVEAKLELQAANNTAAIQLEALKSKGDIMDKMADCCCEIKERVEASGCSIKDLIRATDSDRLRDALQAAETRNLVNESRRCNNWWFPPPPGPFPFPPQGPQ
jgi:hypothetical protein